MATSKEIELEAQIRHYTNQLMNLEDEHVQSNQRFNQQLELTNDLFYGLRQAINARCEHASYLIQDAPNHDELIQRLNETASSLFDITSTHFYRTSQMLEDQKAEATTQYNRQYRNLEDELYQTKRKLYNEQS